MPHTALHLPGTNSFDVLNPFTTTVASWHLIDIRPPPKKKPQKTMTKNEKNKTTPIQNNNKQTNKTTTISRLYVFYHPKVNYFIGFVTNVGLPQCKLAVLFVTELHTASRLLLG